MPSRCRVRHHFALVAALYALSISPARAGHPMLTEDTGTQGTGNLELEFGQSWTRDGDDRVFLFQPQLSYGITPTLDLIAQPSWLSVDADARGTVRGFGDSNLDAKWRFYGAAPLSLGVRAGLTLATSSRGLGQPHGSVEPHALMVATLDVAPFTIDGNLGWQRAAPMPGARHALMHASIAANYSASEHMILLLDADIDSNPQRADGKAPAVLLAGAIYTTSFGLDLDVGYRARLNAAAVAREWLLGLTYRWAP